MLEDFSASILHKMQKVAISLRQVTLPLTSKRASSLKFSFHLKHSKMTAKSAPTVMKVGGRQGQAFKDKSKPADIRASNINAAKGNRSPMTLCLCNFIVKINLNLIEALWVV